MIIADTGFFYALMNSKDKYHQQSVEALKTLQSSLITTYPVITETCHLLLQRKGTKYQTQFLKSLDQGFAQIFQLEEKHLPRIIQFTEQYADLPMDLADASLVILAEDLGHGQIFSTDQRDFGIYRWKNTKPFQNLLIP
jgi:predicted nucleic acid-binding protein